MKLLARSLLLLFLFAPTVRAAERYALLIGVDKCESVGNLSVCCRDARAMKAMLEKVGYDARRVILLTDDAEKFSEWPTLGNIEKEVDRLAKIADRGDTILFFFSGHGISRNGESFLVPTDGSRQRGVALADVKAQLDASKAAKKILILDACHSGAAKGVNGIAPSLAVSETFLMLLSCDRDQVSWPDEERGHSVFTFYLLEALSGRAAGADRTLTFGELAVYVRDQVKDWTFANRKELQTPIIVAADHNAIVAECPPEGIDIDADVPSVERLPRGWTSETRRVKVATPEGEQWKEITYYKNTIGMEFVKIPADEFMMGSPDNEKDHADDEGPQHRVRITNPFYMGRTEVTNEQYQQFLRESGYDGKQDADSDYLRHHRDWSKYASTGSDYPIVCVSWKNAQKFCEWLSRKEGVTCRLPTEAEWEYACRAGTRTRFCNGDSENGLGTVAWYSSNSVGKTHPVGGKRPNAWGLYDMHGNVWEWCADWYDEDYYRNSPASDPAGPANGKYRVLRGGSWNNEPWYCRSAYRIRVYPTSAGINYGFRICVVLQEFNQ